ncbi:MULTISPECIES: metal-dependent hydrolase [unclassified Meiothermus]|uniref:metal-dependent hydrolase n=1 Tax=unclassified Meiothermus TaxID=370471 RepID=UPI000D7CF997|nr:MULTISPECIES: metal-dependent hydrolase [unclassified Meiothermus]PZA08788.1 metal-dependent hydrolase [Meiothermus sp. Pnk-1]RYM40590.1 metal-dependent hydrolase [Meiothermus sp. PNK-Is4]
MLELRYLGHSAVYLSDGTTRIVVDPFLSGNPTASLKAEELEVDYVLVTHAHGDHWGDSLALAQKGATIIGTAEIGYYAERKGAKAIPMNIGGKFRAEWGSLKLTPAWHSSSFPDGTYGGMPTGIILELGGKRIYHAGDTALFSDMSLIGKHGIDLACLPIGDHFTMGPDEALQALELIRPKAVLPIHYNTFPPIVQDGEAFVARARLLGIEGRALKPGEVWSLG